jgi:hypothetical protein
MPVVHLHTPTGRTYCGAPRPADRVNGWTAYRSECTCPDCLATLSPTFGVIRAAAAEAPEFDLRRRV